LISSDEPSTSYGPPNKQCKLSSLLREATSAILCGTLGAPEGEKSNEEKMRDEVEEYPKLSTIDPEMNPLKWWKYMPQISCDFKTARKYLCICASIVLHQNEYSVSVSKKRNSLKPDKVNMLVFLAKNL